MSKQTEQVPVVDYLVLDPDPHLVADECSTCRARFFDRRWACAACGAREFSTVPIDGVGRLKTFTIVGAVPPGVAGPYVAAIVDCGGTDVRANVINVDPRPESLRPGMRLRMRTVSLGRDADGVEAIGYAFEPQPEPEPGGR